MSRPLGRLAGTAKITGGAEWQQICRLEGSDPEGEQYTGTVSTTAGPILLENGQPLPAISRVVIRARIGYKNAYGGSGVVEQYTLAGNPLTFAGTYCYVDALIAPNELADFNVIGGGTNATGQAPLSTNVTAQVTAIIGLGGSSDLQPTQWIQPFAPLQLAQQVTKTQTRLRQVQGYNAGPDAAYLMFFDTANGNAIGHGAVPLFTIPVGGAPAAPGAPLTFSNDFITSARVFQYGLFWAISSTPDTFTAAGAADLFRVDIEVFGQIEVLGSAGNP
jgi:hypothetical protein